MFNKKTIAIIGAMDCEIDLIKDFMQKVKVVRDKAFLIYVGTVGSNNVVLAKSGVGKVAAASCTQYLIDNYNPDCILNTGVAGGIDDGLKIEDVVVADSFIQHDFNVTALGYAQGYVCNGVESNKPTVFYSDKNLIEQMKKAALEVLPKENVHVGRIVSGDFFVADVKTKQQLKKQFNAMAAEMESSAIAHCASLNNVPFVAIRAISDLADGTKIENYPEFEVKTAQTSAKIINTILLK